ncbi:DNA-binding response regulator, NarL/FixJ family, contains REC and HTH domains [Tenacibaculum sp. 190524A02b]|uniref:DNA-binding response regulator, NarL/FixJ family, contains REC and HTH domains n=1 Tax=Tenacibaculum vairaonense TaxID=3137860 RepID=A0ABP1F7P0_9FLAO
MKKINIVIADDNRFFCDALKDSVQQHNDFLVKATFNHLNDLINYTNHCIFDILILDVNFNGISSLEFINEIRPVENNFKIILLTTLNNNLTKQEALEKGIDAFVGKDSDLSSFKNTIINTLKNGSIKTNNTKAKISINNTTYTKRKIEILRALYKHSDKNEKALSKILHISESALKSHKRELFEITDTNNTTELIKYGIKNGLILP